MNEESLFAAALEKATPAERQAYLDEACGGEVALRQRLERLIAGYEQSHGILERAPGSAAALETTLPGTQLAAGSLFAGRFKLREQLGTGGMGEVWVADQLEPVKRCVALKVIRPGLDSARLLARFDQERQALALMDHPHIAKVFDAGVTDGRPYFVMELIKGVAMTNYCDEARLSPLERLELFLPICHAVQHAHQKGIIHRDLKPSNILVALYDGRAVPKVIDFGVAKATGPRLSEQSIYTEVGSLIGTLEYMSPEQAELNNLDIDTRSDIYSLGVVLYELLTGSVPLSRKELQSVAFLEMLRMIREVEARRPSTKLSGSGTLPSVAAARQTEPKRLMALLRGELDWIVMKALEKDRNRRYETANGFAADVQRYLADEPVQACPPSTVYRLQKFVRRNKGPVFAGSMIILLLVAGVAGTTIGLVRAEQRAEGERLAKDSAVKRLAQVERGIKTLATVFTDLDPLAEEKEGRPLRAILGDRLDKAAADLDGEAIGDPLLVAGLQDRLGETYLGLGQPARAEALFTKAVATSQAQLGPDHLVTLGRMDHLAQAYREAGKLREAIALSQRVWDAKLKTLAADDPRVGDTLNDLAMTYRLSGETPKAVALLEQVRDADVKHYGPEDAHTLSTLNNLAVVYLIAGRHPEAIALLEKVLNAKVKKYGEGHAHTIGAMNNLAGAYRAGFKMKQALALFEKARDEAVPKLGPNHTTTLKILDNLAQMYRAYGKTDKAIALGEHVRESRIMILGAHHPETLTTLDDLGLSYQADGQLDKALSLFQEAVAGLEKLNYAQTDADRWVRHLCECHERLMQYDKAEDWRRKWLAVVKAKDGPASPAYAKELFGLASNLLQQKKYADAEPVLRESLTFHQKTQPEASTTFNTQSLLGATLLAQKKYAEAEPLLVQSYQGLTKCLNDPAHKPHGSLTKERRAEALARLVQIYDATNKPDEAAKWRKELEQMKE